MGIYEYDACLFLFFQILMSGPIDKKTRVLLKMFTVLYVLIVAQAFLFHENVCDHGCDEMQLHQDPANPVSVRYISPRITPPCRRHRSDLN